MATVQVIFEGQDKNFTANVQKIQKEMDGLSKKLKEAGVSSAAYNQAIAKQNQANVGAVQSIKNFASANAALIGTITAVAGAAIKSYQAFQQYAGAVRDVALASGSSAEEASRLIQVLDDYQISAQDVMAATKAMTKQGLEPSIETLATLSDEYVKIQDPMQKNEFILKNLGKAGLQWANALNQGGDALRASSEEVSKSLILTDEQIKKAEMARLAVDSWADAWEGFKVSLGGAVGNMIAANSETQDMAFRFHEVTGLVANKAPEAFEKFKAAVDKAAASEAHIARDDTVARIEDLTVSSEEAAEAQKALAESSQKYMSVLNNISNETEQFTEKNQDLTDKLTELENKLADERKGSKAYKDIQGEIDDTKTAITELAAEHAKASKSIMFDLISQQAAANGFKDISVEALAAMGEEWGVLAKGSGDATSQMISQANAWSDALSGVPGQIKSIAEMWQNLRDLAKSGVTLTANVVSQATGGAMGGQNTMTACFTGDTLVTMGDYSTKHIKDIVAGDKVISYDTANGVQVVTTVIQTFEHSENESGTLIIINGALKVTTSHLLWNGFQWRAAGNFVKGDSLFNLDGSMQRVRTIRQLAKREKVYNIHVDHNCHNYFAGGVLVHNAKANDVTTQWQGGTVGSFAGGGKGGGWGIVGDKQGGGWVDGVSELVYGNFKVYPSKQAKGMLKSGMLGKVPGFAFGGEFKDSGSGQDSTRIVTPPYIPTSASMPSVRGGGSSDAVSSAMQFIETQAVDMQASAQNSVAQMAQISQQMTQSILNSNAQNQVILEDIAAILRHENPRAVGKAVAYEVAKGS